MEYLVTMTTHVPDGTPDAAIDDVRSREAAHSKELAAEGHLLRLWRPPLRPGEWRTLGLFQAAGAAEVEAVLRSMPLRIWRTDDVAALSAHPNDPGPQPVRNHGRPTSTTGGEFLTTFTITIPAGTPSTVADDVRAKEAERAHDLAAQGALLRLWTLAGEGRALGLWWVRDTAEMEAIVDSLPRRQWSVADIVPLSSHPSDPGLPG